jgi:S1-C subfamily serine protease
MRSKLAAYSAAGLLALSAMANGVTYAQDATAEVQSAEITASHMAQRTWLGVAVDESLTIIRIAAGSPAESAQLQVGDVILTVDGTSVANADDLRAVVEAAAAGDVVTLTVQRDTAEVSVEVTLTAREGRGMGGGMFAADPLEIAEHSLGVTLEAVDGGYQVVTVEESSAFELEAGDVITAVNGEAIDTIDWRSLRQLDIQANTVTLMVQRGGEEATLTGELSMLGGRLGGNGQPGDRNGNGGRSGNGNNNGQPNGNPPPNANSDQPSGVPPADGSTV